MAGRCIAAKVFLSLRDAGYMKGYKQGHAEILFSLNCIPENLDHCLAETTSGSYLWTVWKVAGEEAQ